MKMRVPAEPVFESGTLRAVFTVRFHFRMWYRRGMKVHPNIALLTYFSILFLVGCSETLNAIPGLPFTYDDFGTEEIASRLLGPKGKDTQVIARFGSTRTTQTPGVADIRYVNVEQAMFFLRSAVRKLPKNLENLAVHNRLSATYSRLNHHYSTRRSALLSAPSSSYGRGGMNRAFLMPPMPPSI